MVNSLVWCFSVSYTVHIRRMQLRSAKQAAKSGDERIVMLEGLK